MNCASCGASLPPGAGFCPQCGTKAGAGSPSAGSDPSGQLARPTPGDKEAEQQLWEGNYSGKSMIGSWLAGGVFSILLIVAAVLFPPAVLVILALLAVTWIALILTLAYRKLSIRYELTSQRLIHKSGILTRRTDRIEMIDIDDVTCEQGLIERMMGVGRIRISSSDRTHPELVLIGIDDVTTVANQIDDVRRTERRKRGLHIENI